MSKRKRIEVPIQDDDRNLEPEQAEAEAAEQAEGAEERARSDADAGAGSQDHENHEDDSGASVEGELGKTLDHLKRLQAEFDNYRKRTDRERHQTVAWAQSELAADLLPVLDDFDRALEHLSEEEAQAAEGFVMVAEKMRRILELAGLEHIPAVGEAFDPNLHEALLTEPVEEEERVGMVLEELVPGYRFKDRVIRPSRVKVGMERSD